jgi:hypothetical protein
MTICNLFLSLSSVDFILKSNTFVFFDKDRMINVGNVVNKGIEIGAGGILFDTKSLYWEVSANFARNINTITDLGKRGDVIYGNGLEEKDLILREGEALGSFYGFVFDGVVQSGEDVTQLPIPNWKGGYPEPGDPKIADVSGRDGAPDKEINSFDRVVLGSSQPDFIYGLSTSLRYRNFDLFALFQGSYGNKVYNKLRCQLEKPNETYNMSAVLLDRWTPDNPSTTIPRADVRLAYSVLDSRYIEDASFLKLRNITLGYTLPVRISQSLSVKCRIFASALNLLTITPYQGYDPEVAGGIDLGVYPSARTFLIGLGLSF